MSDLTSRCPCANDQTRKPLHYPLSWPPSRFPFGKLKNRCLESTKLHSLKRSIRSKSWRLQLTNRMRHYNRSRSVNRRFVKLRNRTRGDVEHIHRLIYLSPGPPHRMRKRRLGEQSRLLQFLHLIDIKPTTKVILSR